MGLAHASNVGFELWGIGMMIMMARFWSANMVAVILGMRWFVGQRGETCDLRAESMPRSYWFNG
jgi:hypothetical protein